MWITNFRELKCSTNIQVEGFISFELSLLSLALQALVVRPCSCAEHRMTVHEPVPEETCGW